MGGAAGKTLVLGVGNLLWADEGFGVRCIERLAQCYEAPPDVELLDGGTQGIALVPAVGAAEQVILFDAADFRAAPGELLVARDAEVPRVMGADKMSLHQAGMNDVLACVELLGRSPRRLTLIGVQPVQLDDYGGSLTPIVRQRVEQAVAIALEELGRWGISLQPRAREAAQVREVLAPALGLAVYEQGRPDEQLACRTGDDRVLAHARARAAGVSGA
ncbi:MAG: HyaD/HybD family hydrogenase maturation endopeptidase [Steroidobacteraceae bacterium]